ncbi:hypothetical protein [Costertonia aggregata]|uniref:Uncharacterized protein n=1 Tax=Costertonia aggregata TaxID=343403 RepID=A0A7H9AL81_9FLAO|nr:hypothetical protein [Costertonia aggregata]QLG44209.1 hypothetical protein HYG79_02210 [Costertonia aggregata]
MKCVELNPTGHFDPWEPEKISELKANDLNRGMGNDLMFENETVKLWGICLRPYERLPFRKQKGQFSWTCVTGGLAISRYSDGKICLLRFEKGDVAYWNLENDELISDLENIGEDVLRITILEHKPLPNTKPSKETRKTA